MAMSKSTLPEAYRPMMGRPSVKRDFCAVCGRSYSLNQHHVVRRGAGRLYDEDGREVSKPTVTLCGCGNVLRDADGRLYCHGLAHANRLHFRWNGGWEFALFDEPTGYMDALARGTWRKLEGR